MYKIKQGFVLSEVAGQYIVVAVGKNTKTFNKMINLNESSAFIWKLLEKGAELDSIVDEMAKEYDADKDTLKRDITDFIDKLDKAGLLTK